MDWIKYGIMQEANPETDGGGKPSPENESQQTMIVRSGDDEVEVTYVRQEDGSFTPEVDEDVDDELVERLKPQILEGSRTLGESYKKNMLQNQEQKKLDDEKKKLAAEKEAFEREKRAHTRNQSDGITPEDAKKFWGVDSADDVQNLMNTNHSAWLAGNARYTAEVVASAIKPAQPAAPAQPQSINDIKRTPKTLDDGLGAGGKAKPVSEQKGFNNWLAGVPDK